MGHYAKVVDGVVEQVIVAKYDFIKLLPDADKWIKTSYNTKEGKHYKDGKVDDGTPIRKNYAGVGYTYDANRDAFIPPQEHEDWILDEDTCNWVPPVPKPADGKSYRWNFDSKSWVESKEESKPVVTKPAPQPEPQPENQKQTNPYLIRFKR